MSRKPGKRRGRPPIYDPSVIRQLLSERDQSGETLLELETRSDIPAGTLSRWSRRFAQDASKRSRFVEVVITEDLPQEGATASLEVVVPSPHGARHVLVPSGFDSLELQRLIETLEERC